MNITHKPVIPWELYLNKEYWLALDGLERSSLIASQKLLLYVFLCAYLLKVKSLYNFKKEIISLFLFMHLCFIHLRFYFHHFFFKEGYSILDTKTVTCTLFFCNFVLHFTGFFILLTTSYFWSFKKLQDLGLSVVVKTLSFTHLSNNHNFCWHSYRFVCTADFSRSDLYKELLNS